MNRKTMLSAIQPTHAPHLGNYLGALKHWIKMQDDYDCIFFAVDLHAITVRQDPKELRENTFRMIATYLAAGLDPARSLLFIQSQVPEHTELSWILNCHATMGELGRMTQYKDKSAKEGTQIPAGLFTYPVLMAADILLYDTHLVPVGSDQKQHVELTRDLAIRMNHLYDPKLFTVPEPLIAKSGARIMSLQNPTSKMSKSDLDPHATVFLTDSDDMIRKKIKRAMTDSGNEITDDESKPGVRNLLDMQTVITGKSIPELVASYAGKQYGHLKLETAEIVIAELQPIREKTEALMNDKAQLLSILKGGAEKAREKASRTLNRVHELIGLIR